MDVPRFLSSPLRGFKARRKLVGQLVERSRSAVLARVQGRGSSMDPAELAGYIRARAAAVVSSETDRLLRTGESSPTLRPSLVALVTEALIPLTADDLRRFAASAERRVGRRAA